MNWEVFEYDSESSFSFVRPNAENVRMKVRVKNQYCLNIRSGPDVKYKVLRTVDKHDGWLVCTSIYTCVPKRSGQPGVWGYITNSTDANGVPVNGWACMSYVDICNLEE